jgi:beta-galactosidase
MMKKINFCDGWHCRRCGEGDPFLAVTIPHDAMLSEPKSPLAAGGTNIGWIEGDDYEYQKTFTPPDTWAEKQLVLEFEGVYHNAEVYLNGEQLMFRPYGYTNFYVDLTGRVRWNEENVLRVLARNADQPNSRWYSGAGIYRPVQLWMADKTHIALNGVKVRTVELHPAVIEVSVRTVGTGEVTIEIAREGITVCTQTVPSDGCAVAQLQIPEAKLWELDAPNLYTCIASFGTDQEAVEFGIRTLQWGEDGLQINGKRVILQGACIHHDNGVLGACCYEDAEWRKIKILKENGYNAIRSAHNPCSKALLAACDHQGVLVMDEYIDHWYIHKTEHDYVDYFAEWWQQDLSDMVEKDYNHPSVILYSIGNEVSETAQPRGIQLTKEMTDFLHQQDGTRPVTCGVNIFFNFLSSIGFGVYSDEKAKKEAEKAEKRKQKGEKQGKSSAVGSQFFNNMAGLFGDGFMKMGATLHGCDVKTRDAFAQMDIAGYNYGILRYPGDLQRYPKRLILGSETFCKDAFRFRELAKTNPRIVGDFVWAGMDYLGEVMIGAWEYGDYAPKFDGGVGWVSAGSGRIDLTGKPLGEAYYTRVALEQDLGPYIAVCPVNHTGDRHSPSAWKMSNAIDSWSWHGCGGKRANVEVYARADRVSLFLNGQKVASRKLKKDCIARFSIPYQDGVLEAVSYGGDGKLIGRCSLKTASEKTELRAVPEMACVKAGHLSYIRLQYTDENGIVKPLERGILRVSVSGGKLLGIGSACPYNKMSYCGKETDTYYGEALAVVQAGAEGTIKLEVTDGKHMGWVQVNILSEG